MKKQNVFTSMLIVGGFAVFMYAVFKVFGYNSKVMAPLFWIYRRLALWTGHTDN